MNSKSISSLNSWSSSLSSWSEQQQQQGQLIFNPDYHHMLHSNIPEYGVFNDQNQPQFQLQYQSNIKLDSTFQFRRPITGTQNTLLKNKPVPNMTLLEPLHNLQNSTVKYSRKVFIGGLPPDIAENEIVMHFRRYGQLIVDWPHKSESKSLFPPKGYAFLIFEKESSVQELINYCVIENDKYYICISSPSIKDKPVQIRPWSLSDSDYLMDNSQPVDSRKTIFVGGVPRPLKAYELATIMNRLYGGVCYAGIDIDPELKYPKGAGRVSFSNQASYVTAITARFVQLQHCDIEKRAEVKPYVLDDQICDFCKGSKCNGRYAPFFCANVTCLQYFCEQCWTLQHSKTGKDFHKPLVKEGADRPRTIPFKWC